tara:strand:+ start:144 stop:395 length:252 start_codon:yes stop_codon:yes gene_type:complete
MNNVFLTDRDRRFILKMDNATLQNFVNQRKDSESELAIFARSELANRKGLKSWQDGSLINTDAINKLSLKDLNRVAKILEGVK